MQVICNSGVSGALHLGFKQQFESNTTTRACSDLPISISCLELPVSRIRGTAMSELVGSNLL
jgi:hypothetical protein